VAETPCPVQCRFSGDKTLQEMMEEAFRLYLKRKMQREDEAGETLEESGSRGGENGRSKF